MNAQTHLEAALRELRADAFDPIDLAVLGERFGVAGIPVGIETASSLVDVAKLLHRLWLAIPEGEFAGVWAYEVTEPLGDELAAMPMWTFADAERIARRHIAGAA